MDWRETVAGALVGEPAERERRMKLLQQIAERFAREREHGVQNLLQEKMAELERRFQELLGKLDAKR